MSGGLGGLQRRRIQRVEFSFGRVFCFLVISVMKYASVNLYFFRKKSLGKKQIAKKNRLSEAELLSKEFLCEFL